VLLESLYELCTMILHLRWQEAIPFHDGIHGFRRGRGTNTAILEVKLGMQFAWTQPCPYFQIFLDLHKAYDSLDRERVLKILDGYGVGPHALQFLRTNWSRTTLFPRSNGYYGRAIRSERGAYQGCTASPTLFDIIIDCVLREWFRLMEPSNDIVLIFYADDGRLAGFCTGELQRGLDLLKELFARIGLEFNVDKTKAMIAIGAAPSSWQSPEAYKRRCDHSLPSYRERKLAKVSCSQPGCGKSLSNQCLPTHMREVHGIIPSPEINTDHLPPELTSP